MRACPNFRIRSHSFVTQLSFSFITGSSEYLFFIPNTYFIKRKMQYPTTRKYNIKPMLNYIFS